ncbi:hypothetical protein DL93DRAFT_1500399 [Clavulina sp. PMI_390]|nr:hypothetical protein DL93DRAFT_1500399 [Clavulina sp. PMI_390]
MWSSLPFELISDIFQRCVDDVISQPEILSHINSSLRQVALSTPCLWTHIYYEGFEDLERCKAFLERSASAPLTLDLNLSPLSNDPDQLVQFVTVIVPHWSRIRDLRLAPYEGVIQEEDWYIPRTRPHITDDFGDFTTFFHNMVIMGVETIMKRPRRREDGDTDAELTNFIGQLSKIPYLHSLGLTTYADRDLDFWSPRHDRRIWELPLLRKLRIRGRSLGFLNQLSTPSITSIHLDMIEEGAGFGHFQHFLRWLYTHKQTLRTIDIVNAQRMRFGLHQAEDNTRPEPSMLPSLTRLNATCDPLSMAALLRSIHAPDLTEVFLGLHMSTERSSLIEFFESVSASVRSVHIGFGPMTHSGGHPPLNILEQAYSLSTPRITFHELETFISEPFVGGAVIEATRAAPRLRYLMLSGPRIVTMGWEHTVGPEYCSTPLLQAPSLHTMIINGFSHAGSCIDAPNLKHFNILAVKQHLWPQGYPHYQHHAASTPLETKQVARSSSLDPVALDTTHVAEADNTNEADEQKILPRKDPQHMEGNTGYGGAGNYHAGHREVDLVQVFDSKWPQDWSSPEREFDSKNFKVRNDREAYGWILHALADFAGNRKHRDGVSSVEAITITRSKSDERDWSLPEALIEYFGKIGVTLADR